MKASLEVKADPLLKNLASWIDLTENFVPFFVEVLGQQEDKRDWTLRGSALRRFSTKTNSSGYAWQPLTEKYQIEKAKKYPGMPLLVRTGDLFNSLIRNNSFSVVIMDKKKLSFGTLVPYAPHVNWKRSFMGYSEEQKLKIKTLLIQYMKESFKGKREAEKAMRGSK